MTTASNSFLNQRWPLILAIAEETLRNAHNVGKCMILTVRKNMKKSSIKRLSVNFARNSLELARFRSIKIPAAREPSIVSTAN